MELRYFVYIMTNARHTVLYTGVTSHLIRRVFEHRTHAMSGFTSRFNVEQLVFYEQLPDAAAAIAREKQIKAGSRARKPALIAAANPNWRDLYEDLT